MSNIPEIAGYTVTTAETEWGITLAEAKADLNIEGTDDDTYITELIKMSTTYFEKRTWTTVMQKTFTAQFRKFPCNSDGLMRLAFPPLISVTSIKYIDGDNVQQTWAGTEYDAVIDREPGYIRLAYDKDWASSVRDHPDSVEVIYVAGYATVGDVPQTIKRTLLMLINHWYSFREPVISGTIVAEVPFTLDVLIDQHSARHTGTYGITSNG